MAIYKFVAGDSADIKAFNDEERSFTAWASRGSMDRDDEEIDPSGWITKDFRKNPVVPLFHDYHQFPIAKSLWEKPDPKDNPIGLLFKPQFAETYLGMESYYLYKEGFMNAFSVGFEPIEWMDSDGDVHTRDKDGEYAIWLKGYIEQKKKKPRCRFLKQILLEISGVLVPAHPDAIVEARSFVHTPQLKAYLDDMIEKSRKPMIAVEEQKGIKIEFSQELQAFMDKVESKMEEMKKLFSKHPDIDEADLYDIEIGDDDDIDLESIEVEIDASGDDGDTSDDEFVVEVSVESGDDARLIEVAI